MDKYYGVIIAILSAILAIAGIVQTNAAKRDGVAIWGLTPIGIALVVFGVLGAILGIKVAINEANTENNPIVVSPATNSINISEYTNKIPFEVYNRGDETKYDVWVDITWDNASIKNTHSQNIDIEIFAADGRSFVAPQGGKLFNEDVLFMPTQDEHGQNHMLLIFRSLSPRAPKQFEILVTASSVSKKSINLTLLFNVISFKSEPYPFLLKDDSATITLTSPIGFNKMLPFLVLEKRTIEGREKGTF